MFKYIIKYVYFIILIFFTAYFFKMFYNYQVYNYLYLDSFLFFIFYLFVPYKRENYTNMKTYNLCKMYKQKLLMPIKNKETDNEARILIDLIYKIYS